MRKLTPLFLLLAVFVCASARAQSPDPVVRFSTTLGNIDVQLSPADAPLTVANFLGYVDRGDYNGSFIHRSVANFIIQGGGYTYVNGSAQTITEQPPVTNEYKLSNVRGTIAMAKLGTDPNSATDQWFFNLADNSSNLNNQNSGFTVFGNIINPEGLAVMDAIAAVPVYNAGSPFDMLPAINYTGGNITVDNLVNVNSITRLASHPAFFNGEVSVGNAVNFLMFSNGTPFGYYSYLADSNYIYHFDLGFEYVFDANDGHGGVYFYDFASNGFFYTSPTFPFPYLYDFSLQSVVYYFPDTTNPGHYTSNPRYFAVIPSGQIITK